jgi:hypothetical protein
VLYKSNDRVLKAKHVRETMGMGICTLERRKLGRVMEELAEVQCMLWGFGGSDSGAFVVSGVLYAEGKGSTVRNVGRFRSVRAQQC